MTSNFMTGLTKFFGVGGSKRSTPNSSNGGAASSSAAASAAAVPSSSSSSVSSASSTAASPVADRHAAPTAAPVTPSSSATPSVDMASPSSRSVPPTTPSPGAAAASNSMQQQRRSVSDPLSAMPRDDHAAAAANTPDMSRSEDGSGHGLLHYIKEDAEHISSASAAAVATHDDDDLSKNIGSDVGIYRASGSAAAAAVPFPTSAPAPTAFQCTLPSMSGAAAGTGGVCAPGSVTAMFRKMNAQFNAQVHSGVEHILHGVGSKIPAGVRTALEKNLIQHKITAELQAQQQAQAQQQHRSHASMSVTNAPGTSQDSSALPAHHSRVSEPVMLQRSHTVSGTSSSSSVADAAAAASAAHASAATAMASSAAAAAVTASPVSSGPRTSTSLFSLSSFFHRSSSSSSATGSTTPVAAHSHINTAGAAAASGTNTSAISTIFGSSTSSSASRSLFDAASSSAPGSARGERAEGEPPTTHTHQSSSHISSPRMYASSSATRMPSSSISHSSEAAMLAEADGHWSTQYASRRTVRVPKKSSIQAASPLASGAEGASPRGMTSPGSSSGILAPTHTGSSSVSPVPLDLTAAGADASWTRIDGAGAEGSDDVGILQKGLHRLQHAGSSASSMSGSSSSGRTSLDGTARRSLASNSVHNHRSSSSASSPSSSSDVSNMPAGSPQKWSVTDVQSFLSAIGLDEHKVRFQRSQIDGETLNEVTDEDLVELGVIDRFHRRKILKKLAAAVAVASASPAAANANAAAASSAASFADMPTRASSNSVPGPSPSGTLTSAATPIPAVSPSSSSLFPPNSSAASPPAAAPEAANPSPPTAAASNNSSSSAVPSMPPEYVSNVDVEHMLRSWPPSQRQKGQINIVRAAVGLSSAAAATAAVNVDQSSSAARTKPSASSSSKSHHQTESKEMDPYHDWGGSDAADTIDDGNAATASLSDSAAVAVAIASVAASSPLAPVPSLEAIRSSVHAAASESAHASTVATRSPSTLIPSPTASKVPSSTSSTPSHLNIIDLGEIEDLRHLNEGAAGVALLGRYRNEWVVVKQPKKKVIGSEEWLELQLHMKIPEQAYVIPFMGICMVALQVYFVTKFIERGSLKSLLTAPADRGGDEFRKYYSHPLSILKAAAEIATGLAHLHAHHIVHRDVASRNVLVTSNGTHIISDLGLSRWMEKRERLPSSSSSSTTASTGVAVAAEAGSHASTLSSTSPEFEETYTMHSLTAIPARWTAPESLRTQVYTDRSDVYSLGVCMWEMNSGGALPYPHIRNNMDVIAGVLLGELELHLPASTDPAVAHFIRLAMMPVATRPSMIAFRDQLVSYLHQHNVQLGLP